MGSIGGIFKALLLDVWAEHVLGIFTSMLSDGYPNLDGNWGGRLFSTIDLRSKVVVTSVDCCR